MNIADLIIIYLACGAPFGVYQATSRQRPGARIDWLRVTAAFLLWPVISIVVLGKRLSNSDAARSQLFMARLEELRLDIEDAALTDKPAANVFEFRESFYRFTGLSAAVREASIGAGSAEIFDVSGHENRSLASRCLARRNTSRLVFHRQAAREEFLDLISGLASTAADRDELMRVGAELAEHLDDSEATAAFDALSDRATLNSESNGDLEKEVWKSRTHSQSTMS